MQGSMEVGGTGIFCGRNIVSQSPAPAQHRECLGGQEIAQFS